MPCKGIGLYVGEDEVFVSKVSGKPSGGTVELERHGLKYEPDQLATVIGELLEVVSGPERNISPVAVGIATRRVFYSTLGHTRESWDDPRVRSMYYEGILWALGLRAMDVRPHPAG